MTTKASELVGEAKKFAKHYGDYSNGQEGAAWTAALRFFSAWKDNDPEALAAIFMPNGSFLAGDYQMTERQQIQDYLADAFAAGYAGTQIQDVPVLVRPLSENAAVLVSVGGVLPPGRESLETEEQVRSLWVVQRDGADWKVLSYQNSPIHS